VVHTNSMAEQEGCGKDESGKWLDLVIGKLGRVCVIETLERRGGLISADVGVGFMETSKTIPGVRVAEKEKEARAWNTRNIGWRVGTDVIAAASAGVLVAPVITIIDR